MIDNLINASDDAAQHFNDLKDSVTQREWLIACNKLGVTRNQIDSDYGVLLLVLAWVQEKRNVGSASWDKLLEMTDEEILSVLGLNEDETPDTDEQAEERQDAPDSPQPSEDVTENVAGDV